MKALFPNGGAAPLICHSAYASQPKRAGSRTSLAELGTLSVEFTRLAQLSKEPKFYDAVARITDAMEEVQGQTRIPGLWPLYLDAAGCKKSEIPTTIGDNTGHQMMKRDGAVAPVVPVRAEPDEGNPKPESEAGRQKWQAQELLSECVPQKLATPNGYQDTFSLGGGTDSHYEYLPKVGSQRSWNNRRITRSRHISSWEV